MNSRIVLSGLEGNDYEHPADREALATLQRLPTLSFIIRKVNELGLDKILLLGSLGNKVKVTDRQLPTLFSLFTSVCTILDIQPSADVFIEQAFVLTAYAQGVSHPHITLTTALVDELTDDQLAFVLGHEVGHVKSSHVLYHQVGACLPALLTLLGEATMGLGRVIGAGVEVALYDWIRKSEYSADRAGLLACQDPSTAVSALCRLAGIPNRWLGEFTLEEFEGQARALGDLTRDQVSKLYLFFGQMWRTHPWLALRLGELRKWVASGSYDAILRRSTPRAADAGGRAGASRNCSSCGRPVADSSMYCVNCGTYHGPSGPGSGRIEVRPK